MRIRLQRPAAMSSSAGEYLLSAIGSFSHRSVEDDSVLVWRLKLAALLKLVRDSHNTVQCSGIGLTCQRRGLRPLIDLADKGE